MLKEHMDLPSSVLSPRETNSSSIKDGKISIVFFLFVELVSD